MEIQKNHYETRFISKSNQQHKASFYYDKNEPKILMDYVFEYDKMVLLGNPGIGKTRELENLFDLLWEVKDSTGLIPFSLKLKNFRKGKDFEELIKFKNWKELYNVIFILDGLDEIEFIQDFLSAFEIFISQNSERNIKYLISCRTNIFEKYLVNISNFETFFLENLTYEQAKSILKNKYNVNIDDLKLQKNHSIYIQTPFFLELLAEYYLNNKKILPQSDAIMWDNIVDNALKIYKEKRLKEELKSIPKIKSNYEKVAFINELMQRNYFTDDELYKILKEDSIKFIEYPYITAIDDNKFSFEHRQMQEYFVAKLLSKREFDQILNIVKIEGVNNIHPSFFNVMTFLINLLEIDSEVFKKIIKWINENQIELFFKADKSRIQSYRVKVFQDYFKCECIEKTFWISTNRTFSVNEIAAFGDCEDNFDYLTNLIINNKNHFRVIISALELLSHFNIPIRKRENLKKEFLKLLDSLENSNMIKSHILNCIHNLNLCSFDEDYLNQILKIFKNETNKQINREILNLIEAKNNIDDYFLSIKNEFLLEFGIHKREVEDKVIRGNSWVLEGLVLRFNNYENFIDLAKFYFYEEHRAQNTGKVFIEKLISKCILFDENHDDFMIKLISSFDKSINHYYFRDTLFKNLILKCKLESQNVALKYIIENYDFFSIRFFLASIVNQDTILIIINRFKDGTILKDNLDYFRDAIAKTNDRKLALFFNNEMISKGFSFDETFIDEIKFEELKNNYLNKPQKNFDFLFDKQKLLKEIKKIFDENGSLINSISLREIESKWYDKNGHSNIIDISISVLSKILQNIRNDLKFEDIEEILKNDYLIIKIIKTQIENYLSNDNIRISDKQKEFIKLWCIKVSEEIDFEKIFHINNFDSFNLLEDYNKLKTVLYFGVKFDYKFSKDFLLNCIVFFDVDKIYDENPMIDWIKEKLKDDNAFYDRIISNLLNKKLTSFSKRNHIQIALDNNLKITYPKIREYLLLNVHLEENELKKYIELSNDIELLKELTNNIESNQCWLAIKLLMQYEKEKDLCYEKSIEYLNSQIRLSEKYYYSSALTVLFKLKSLEVFKYLFDFMECNILPSLEIGSYKNFDVIDDYNILNYLFKKIYLGNRDKIGFSGLGDFLNNYVSNLSNNKEGYNLTQKQLLKIKDDDDTKIHEHGLFYINILIDASRNSYINSQSRALTFEEALKKVEEIIS